MAATGTAMAAAGAAAEQCGWGCRLACLQGPGGADSCSSSGNSSSSNGWCSGVRCSLPASSSSGPLGSSCWVRGVKQQVLRGTHPRS
jgi:hypothetical protein